LETEELATIFVLKQERAFFDDVDGGMTDDLFLPCRLCVL
jgi:hypothetical protein